MGFDFNLGGSSSRKKVMDKARILVLGDFAGRQAPEERTAFIFRAHAYSNILLDVVVKVGIVLAATNLSFILNVKTSHTVTVA